MIKFHSDFCRTSTAFEAAVPFQPVPSAIIYCFGDVESHVEPTVIALSESQTNFSLVLIHFGDAKAWILSFEEVRVCKYLFVS